MTHMNAHFFMQFDEPTTIRGNWGTRANGEHSAAVIETMTGGRLRNNSGTFEQPAGYSSPPGSSGPGLYWYLNAHGSSHASALPSILHDSAGAGLVVVWGVDAIPGEDADNALKISLGSGNGEGESDAIQIIKDHIYWDDTAQIPNDVTGVLSSVLVPVVEGGYGHSETVYIDPELAIGYGYMLNGTNRFHTYMIPDPLPQGDDMFRILYNHNSYDLVAGEIFDFTMLDPLGVDSFLLMGIDETELIDSGNSHPPFVFGTTFMTPGLAEVTTFALVAGSETSSSSPVPEPSTFALLGIGTICLMLAGGSRKRKTRQATDESPRS